MTLFRFTVANLFCVRARFHDCLLGRSWATFENIEFSFIFKKEPILSMSVEQKIPTWALKNFKYEVGLTRRQSDFIRDKLFY